MGVLALQGDGREHIAAFQRCGAGAEAVRTPDELDRADALALPGGESTTMSRLLRAFGLEQPLRERVSAGMPCFATCAGLILLSREIVDGRDDQLALGAIDIAVRRNGYGRQVESFEAGVAIPAAGSPSVFPAIFIRAPRVCRAGAGVEVLGELDGDPVAVRSGRTLAFAFHPELSQDDRLHRLFVEGLAADVAA